MHVKEATNTILESPYGIHALVVYSDMATSREFWSFYTKKSIEEKNNLFISHPSMRQSSQLETHSQKDTCQ